jgi:hypothetical protein
MSPHCGGEHLCAKAKQCMQIILIPDKTNEADHHRNTTLLGNQWQQARTCGEVFIVSKGIVLVFRSSTRHSKMPAWPAQIPELICCEA